METAAKVVISVHGDDTDGLYLTRHQPLIRPVLQLCYTFRWAKISENGLSQFSKSFSQHSVFNWTKEHLLPGNSWMKPFFHQRNKLASSKRKFLFWVSQWSDHRQGDNLDLLQFQKAAFLFQAGPGKLVPADSGWVKTGCRAGPQSDGADLWFRLRHCQNF